MRMIVCVCVCVLLLVPSASAQVPSEKQLQKWLKRFPDADANKDGRLSAEEATAFMRKMRGRGRNPGAPREFPVDPGWDKEGFPDHAVCYKSPEEIRDLYANMIKRGTEPVVSFDKPTDGALRIVATGHSFMAPGFKTFPIICKAAGMDQPLYTHTGGGITGSARYKWEQENGIFEFEGRPTPKLLSSISNASWDAMMWGPYFNDRSKYYSCWVDFCLKYNPDMKFYLSDAWPQLYQLGKNPESEAVFTEELFDKLAKDRRREYSTQVKELLEKYPGRIFILPTCDAMALAGKAFLRDELPGIEGVHKVIGGKQRSLWRDQLGHLGPGFEWLEGYVFYATIYKQSPELIENDVPLGNDFPSRELDRRFRKIAWQAVLTHPLSGVKDEDGDRVGDVQ